MERYSPDFPAKIIGLDFKTIEESPHSIYALSKELKFIYFNLGWFEFAKLNEGEPFISKNIFLGSSFIDFISPKDKDFYFERYSNVIQKLFVWEHEYECSNENFYRIYHQIVYPLKNGEGLIVINSLKIKDQITDSEKSLPCLKNYKQENGFLSQCSNCRRTQRANESSIWDWIPSWIDKTNEKISHTVCPICFDYYWKYPN